MNDADARRVALYRRQMQSYTEEFNASFERMLVAQVRARRAYAFAGFSVGVATTSLTYLAIQVIF